MGMRGERTGPEIGHSEALAMSLMLRERKESQHRPQALHFRDIYDEGVS